MTRADWSPNLVHFTKGQNQDEAFSRFISIVKDQSIKGSADCIRGGYRCICFTEAPLCSVGNGLANAQTSRRYSPFGIMFEKKQVFANGGRPVIYQAGEEFDALPESYRWRHVGYEPDQAEPIDWTWEREWRVRADDFPFSPRTAVLVVPSDHYANCLCELYETEEDIRIFQYSQILDEEIAEQYREGFPWRVAVLSR